MLRRKKYGKYLRKPSYSTAKAREGFIIQSPLEVLDVFDKCILALLMVGSICCLSCHHKMPLSCLGSSLDKFITITFYQQQISSYAPISNQKSIEKKSGISYQQLAVPNASCLQINMA